MASETRPQIDPVTGAATTGHEWDGLQELNIPLPRWWLLIFYATIVWSIGYWIVYPAWPMLTSYSKGAFGWQSRDAVVADLAELKTKRGALMEKLSKASVAEISADRELSDFARAVGKPAFAENCAPCHGAGGGGAKGYPNLNDDDWLWGGKLDDILLTIRHGVRGADDKTRQSPAMPAFGRDGMLTRDQISSVADYVRYVAKVSDAKIDVEKGKKVYLDKLRDLSRRRRQRQARARHSEPDRRNLALRFRQGRHRGRSDQWSRGRDAGMGGASRRYHDQSVGNLRARVRRRREVSHVSRLRCRSKYSRDDAGRGRAAAACQRR